MRPIHRFPLVAVTILALGGCAFTTATLDVGLKPTAEVSMGTHE